ncbi:MAG: hypothetical protein AWT59_2372 [Candidatus Gallionella acididurans]|uniref:Uncharacterized protein n=1 Tax=Candidatus Gallionella acididurans TaxID=1796491 RepID=A0A139BS16_9PROT|nr:MAG: hypothetical protein AWT59_2372 [Candidatus Gallionella acididurans]
MKKSIIALVAALSLSINCNSAMAQWVILSESENMALLAPFAKCDDFSQQLKYEPMQNLDAYDESQVTLVREYIELTRRSKHASWDDAGAIFSGLEHGYQENGYLLTDYGRRAKHELSQYSANELPSRDYLNFDLQTLKNLYDKACKARADAHNEIMSLNSKLASLRAEPLKPWLNPKKRIPCPVMFTLTCRRLSYGNLND